LEIKLKQLNKSIEDRSEIIKQLDEEILEEFEEDEEIMKEIEDAGKFTEQVNEILIRIGAIDTKEAAKIAPENSPNPSISPIKESGKITAKLPELILKKFAGEPTQWQSFYDGFRSAIHENVSLTSIDKFNCLRSLLEGNALATIAGLPLTASYYDAAIEILMNRFGDKQIIINSQMDSLLNLSAVNHPDTKRLRILYDSVEKHIRGLEALGVNSEQYENLLVPILMSKIPQEFQLVITRKIGKDSWDLGALLNLFKGELEAR
jgi:hypothetical protein